MAIWTRDRPLDGGSRTLVRDIKTGEQGFVAVHHSTVSGPHLYGVVFTPKIDADGQERGGADGLPLVRTLDRRPTFV